MLRASGDRGYKRCFAATLPRRIFAIHHAHILRRLPVAGLLLVACLTDGGTGPGSLESHPFGKRALSIAYGDRAGTAPRVAGPQYSLQAVQCLPSPAPIQVSYEPTYWTPSIERSRDLDTVDPSD